MQKDGIFRQTLVIALSLAFLFIFIPNPLSPPFSLADTPPTLYVGPDETFIRIQDAIDNSTDGYRIIVYADTYQESIYINHTLDLFGEDYSITTIDGNDANTVITINADNVNISHFTITNSGTTPDCCLIRVNRHKSIITDNVLTNGYHAIILNRTNQHLIYDNTIQTNSGDGIRLIQSFNNINISYNILTNNRHGIFLYQSDSNRIYHNTITENNGNGIFLNHSADNNYIAYNTISENDLNGLYLNDYSNYSTLHLNSITENSQSGIVLENCSIATITRNTVTENTHHGIMLIGSTNTIRSNTISGNLKDGIYLNADDNTTITQNTIQENGQAGIRLYNSTADYIHTNEINNNNQYGIYLDFFAIYNTVYNNYFHHNTHNAIDKSILKNQWNQTPTAGVNVIGGSIIAGNYWDYYDEIIEGVLDANHNGIADSSYTVYNLNFDNAPLLDIIPPTIESITINPTSQTLGQNTQIQVIITDNTEIKNVHLYITCPDTTIQNISIIQNKVGDIYSLTSSFTSLGTYNLSVQTKDPLQWTHSSQQTFHIIEGRPPTIIDKSPKGGHPSAAFTFNATIIDDKDSASDITAIVYWSHASKEGNITLEHQGNNIFTGTIQLDASIKSLKYTIDAMDHWGNNRTTALQTVEITDTKAPHITIIQYTPASGDVPNTFTFTVNVIDDAAIYLVYIKYWYNGSTIYNVTMDNAGQGRYTKTIVPITPQNRVYCIIYATDTSGNTNTTENPTALPGGPYTGFIRTDVFINASASYDLDGYITNYTWNFGDGTTSWGKNTAHQYLSSGTYILTLTVTDNDGNTDSATTTVIVDYFTTIEPSDSTILFIETYYNISLPQKFYCFDSNGDDIADSFVDPNGLLVFIYQLKPLCGESIAIPLSIDDMYIPEFLWCLDSDEILPIDHQIGVIEDVTVDESSATASITVTVNKVNWLYLDIIDQYPDGSLSIITSDRTISSDMILRANGHIYVLDDATTIYHYYYTNIFPPLEPPIFSPPDGGVIDGNHTTITITFKQSVRIPDATFGDLDASESLETGDNKVFFYTPPGYLSDGTITFSIIAVATQGFDDISTSVVYFYFAYTTPPPPSFFDLYGDYFIFAFIGITMLGLVIYLYKKQITLDGYIYIRNKRILPFFKTVVLGPVSVHVDNDLISKAEFYVDGQLKHTRNEPPYTWHWNEHTVMRHSLETKVYDAQGNNVSSGEMDLFVFN
ncbi:MAG: right-handed parallel beta-helix repeat-containing protein, partial [Candidatus Thermoplasmatota archaeon]|nr:right-handed parallel beta-helix repeat-containing protein [Candidatus Thermoplasmatota archaeon]